LHKDVIVQSPTGSGKTLAYLLSVFAILLKVKQIWLAKETAALILVPNRELALQIFDVANHFGEALNIRIRVLLGGKKSKYYAKKVADEGFSHGCNLSSLINLIYHCVISFCRSIFSVNVLIATPGRLEHLIVSDGNFKKSLKSLEILIVDEADRFTESVFKRRYCNVFTSSIFCFEESFF
uniref:ATP-dependent RNA helicase n=1 Tax=Dracunculus medinensis TaxID=318479 RepID=A0A0N4US08_DRAME